jgi:catechol 2,3-dioxygenase-like lactoylglutathione lyase family enzyme
MADNTFHVSLQVADIDSAVDKYRKILGIEPAKVRTDYAKFELVDPPVVLSLNASENPGRVAHLGIRYPSSGELLTERARANHARLDVIDQPNAECCYVRADKFWIRDDDGMVWEMYTSLGDIEADSSADRDMTQASR